MTTHPLVKALLEAGIELAFAPPDTIRFKPVCPSKAPKERLESLVQEAKQCKPEILQALKAQEFKRLCSLVSASVSRVAEIYPEGGIDEACRTGLWPKLLALEHAIDEACKALDEPRLLGALEAWEKTWLGIRDMMARQRQTKAPEPIEATA
jgi:hypothetical protein